MSIDPNGRKLLRIEARNTQTPIERKPEWIKTKAVMGPEYTKLRSLVATEGLHTVCQEAACPNIFECWEDKEATFLIGGSACTRRCDFCNIDTGKPNPLDRDEPRRVAESVKVMDLKYATITGVARDDLDDEGAWLYAETIAQVHALNPGVGVEMLAPDFSGHSHGPRADLRRLGLRPLHRHAHPRVAQLDLPDSGVRRRRGGTWPPDRHRGRRQRLRHLRHQRPGPTGHRGDPTTDGGGRHRQVRVASHPPGAGAQSRRSGGPVLPVAQPHGALPQRRAQTQRRTRPEQQRAGRLFDFWYHVHGLKACFWARCTANTPGLTKGLRGIESS